MTTKVTDERLRELYMLGFDEFKKRVLALNVKTLKEVIESDKYTVCVRLETKDNLETWYYLDKLIKEHGVDIIEEALMCGAGMGLISDVHSRRLHTAKSLQNNSYDDDQIDGM
jgi:hypothetical protein